MIRAKILSRQSLYVLFTEDDLRVERMTLAAFGGLVSAEVILPFAGVEEEYLALVGNYVELWDEEELGRWVGLITNVRVPHGQMTLQASLDDMANSVKVISALGMKNVQTDWVEDVVSIATYGRKQKLLTVSEKTEGETNTLAGKYLELHKEPNIGLDVAGMGGDEVVIGVIGLMQTLDWMYYANDKGYEGYSETGSGGREIGEDDRPKLAQQIQLSSTSGWSAKKIRIRPWKYPENNPPTDDLIVKLCADNSGVPGTALATVTIPASEIGTYSDWVEKEFSSAVSLNPNTVYWITIERSGSVDASKYFMVDTNVDLGYPRGDPYLWYTNLSRWKPAPQKGDLNFELIGMGSVKEQIENIVTNCGQFLNGVEFQADFATETRVFREGYNTALYELKELLKLESNRAIAYVDGNRRLICKLLPTEPTAESNYYYLCSDGRTRYFADVFDMPRLGEYYLLEDTKLRVSFMPEEIEYHTGKWHISRIAGRSSPYQIGEVY
jgi:hypothetical protein